MSEAPTVSAAGTARVEDEPRLVTHDVATVESEPLPTVKRYAVLSGPRGPVTAKGRVEETVGEGCRIEMAYHGGECDRGKLAPTMADTVEVWEFSSILEEVTEESVRLLFESEIRPPAEYDRAVSGTWIGLRDVERFKLRLEMAGLDANAAAAFALASHDVAMYRIDRVLDGERAVAALRRGKRQLREAIRLLGAVEASAEASLPGEDWWDGS